MECVGVIFVLVLFLSCARCWLGFPAQRGVWRTRPMLLCAPLSDLLVAVLFEGVVAVLFVGVVAVLFVGVVAVLFEGCGS